LAESYVVEANGRQYTVVDDCSISYRVLIVGSATDEIFGDLFAPDLRVSIDRPLLNPKATPSGLFAIAGYPEQAFPLLGSTATGVNLTFEATGFRTATAPMIVHMNQVFPAAAPAVALRRLPVRIQGRVVTDTLPRTPVSGVLIYGQNVTLLRSPLYFAHPGGTVVQEVVLSSAGSGKLDSDLRAGVRVLDLHTQSGLAPNVVLRLSNADQSVVEYGVVDHLGPGPVSQPGQVFLTNSLNRSFSQGTVAQFLTAAPGGVPLTLTAQSDAGDGVLQTGQVITGATVVVDPGTPAAEFHEIGALSDSEGFYGLDGMGRVREIALQPDNHANALVEWALDYDQAVNIVDFRI
jgi:hypothetical protein